MQLPEDEETAFGRSGGYLASALDFASPRA
jgi:hypothetical protein